MYQETLIPGYMEQGCKNYHQEQSSGPLGILLTTATIGLIFEYMMSMIF